MIMHETCLTCDQIAQAVLRAFPSLTHSMHAHSNAHMTDNTQQLCTKISPQSSMKQYRATTDSPYPHTRIMTHTDRCTRHAGGEPTGGNKTGGPVGSRNASLISPAAWPPQCSGVLKHLHQYQYTHTHRHTHTCTHTRTQTHTRTHTHTGTNAHIRTSSAQEVQYMTWVHHRKSRCIYIYSFHHACLNACTREGSGIGDRTRGSVLERHQGMWKSCKGTWTHTH